MHPSVADTATRSPAETVIWTVGHGTRSTDRLAGLLAAAGAAIGRARAVADRPDDGFGR